MEFIAQSCLLETCDAYLPVFIHYIPLNLCHIFRITGLYYSIGLHVSFTGLSFSFVSPFPCKSVFPSHFRLCIFSSILLYLTVSHRFVATHTSSMTPVITGTSSCWDTPTHDAEYKTPSEISSYGTIPACTANHPQQLFVNGAPQRKSF